MHIQRRHLVSEDEFLALPESMERVELIDGEVVVAPAPTYEHQEVLARIFVALRTWAAAHPAPVTVLQAPVDIRFAHDRILQPDACVILDRLPRGQKGPIDRVPALCIEVLSTNRIYDRVTKRLIYGAAGVREYWVVEASGLIERWSGPELCTSEEVRDELRSPLLPGFVLDLASIFAFAE